MPEKKSTEDSEKSLPESELSTGDGGEGTGKEEKEKTAPEHWYSGLGAGVKGVSRKLLDQVPPEFREKIMEQARTNGPGAAAVAVNAAALKTRSLKAKLALKTLGGLLKLLDSKVPKK